MSEIMLLKPVALQEFHTTCAKHNCFTPFLKIKLLNDFTADSSQNNINKAIDLSHITLEHVVTLMRWQHFVRTFCKHLTFGNVSNTIVFSTLASIMLPNKLVLQHLPN